MILRASLLAVLLSVPAAPAVVSTSWVDGEMGYRVTVVPDGSVAARHGLRLGDILAEPEPLPARLRESRASGVEIPIYRLNTPKAAYEPATLTITFLEGEEHRLGTTGDLGFLVTDVRPGSLAARAELKAGDFIPKINETFVHAVADLKLVDAAYEKGEQVLIHFTRWYPESASFKDAVSRRRFVK
jgi:S1-C subfamily serine protease